MICPCCGYRIMELTSEAIDLIKSFEGLRLTAYKAVPTEKYWTIGYGHYGPDVDPGMSISESIAEELLRGDLLQAESAVMKYMSRYAWTANEYGALVSFAYNVGNIDQLTAKGTRTKAEIASKMMLYNKSGGKTLAGLTRRREAERNLFLKK